MFDGCKGKSTYGNWQIIDVRKNSQKDEFFVVKH